MVKGVSGLSCLTTRDYALLCVVLLQTKRVDDLRTDISCLELSIGAAKAEYEKIKAVNLAETARFAAERRAEYMSMLENFTATQVGSLLTQGGGCQQFVASSSDGVVLLYPIAQHACSLRQPVAV